MAPGAWRGYPSLVVGPGPQRALAYVSAARDRATSEPGQSNSVFFQRSEDGGRTWSAPVLVMLSGSRLAMQVQLVRTGPDTLHIVWVRSPGPTPPMAIAIEHVVSHDGGRSWSEPRSVPLPPDLRGVGTLTAVPAPDGDLFVAFRGPTTQPHQVIWYSHLEAGELTKAVPLLPDSRRIGIFGLAIDPHGGKHVVWAHAAPWIRTDPPGYRDLRVWYTEQLPCSGSDSGR